MFSLKPFPKLQHSLDTGKAIESAENRVIKERGYNDIEFFVRTFFKHHFWGDFSEMHEEFCRLMTPSDTRGKKIIIAAPRGNAKSTFWSLISVIHSIVYNYEKFTLILGWSANEAKKKVKDIRDELMSNEKLIQVYGPQLDPNCGQYEFTTLNGCLVVPRGRGGQVRGLKHGQYRPTRVILDDFESLESVNTVEQRAKTDHIFDKDIMGAGAADGSTNVVFIGTMLHTESLLAKLLKRPGWIHRHYKAIQSWATNQELWNEWRAVYCDLENPDALADALAFYENNKQAMDEGVNVLWPQGESYYKLQEYIIQNGMSSLNSEKQNEPRDPEMQILDPDVCPTFKVYTDIDPEWREDLDPGFALVRSDTGKPVHSKDLNIIAYLDPALGKKPKGGKSSPDYAALVIMGQDLSGYIYVLDVWLKKLPPDSQIKEAFAKQDRWGFTKLYIESNNFQSLLKDNFINEAKAHENKFTIIGVQQHKNKQARISTLQPYFSNGWILFNERLDPEFINQIRLFPTVHDDGPDALQGGVSRLKKPQVQVISRGEKRSMM